MFNTSRENDIMTKRNGNEMKTDDQALLENQITLIRDIFTFILSFSLSFSVSWLLILEERADCGG